NPPGQMVRDEDGKYTHINPSGPNRNIRISKLTPGQQDALIASMIICVGIFSSNPAVFAVGITKAFEASTKLAIEGLGGDLSTVPSMWGIAGDITNGIRNSYTKSK
ncbi:MAG TPA: hypothetical protein PKY58_13460, partial [Syntrophales bacterium]|nr:hypothetical protein [Syntrophales bacterium]